MKKYILIITILLTSCVYNKSYITDYNGCEIIEKSNNGVTYFIKVKRNNEITGKIFISKKTWNKYNAGDTIGVQK